MKLLETKNIHKNFGALTAVENVDFSIEEGKLNSIIGPNGAGKTTFFNLISGKLKPTSGEILFKGQDITSLPPHKISKMGIARSFQITNIFPGLTVFENVRLAVQSRGKKNFSFFGSPTKLKDVNEKTLSILEKLNLADKRDSPGSNITYSDQRHLEIAMTMATDPILILLDEPTAGMSPEETDMTVNMIRALSQEVTVLLIEHDMDVVFSVSDEITVLYYGKIIAKGSPMEIKDNDEVQRAYLGGSK